jgi:hypothetical protein
LTGVASRRYNNGTDAPIAQWIERGPPEAKAQVRVLVGVCNRTHPEPRTEAVEQFLALLRFEQRSRLEELPIDLKKGGLG